MIAYKAVTATKNPKIYTSFFDDREAVKITYEIGKSARTSLALEELGYYPAIFLDADLALDFMSKNVSGLITSKRLITVRIRKKDLISILPPRFMVSLLKKDEINRSRIDYLVKYWPVGRNTWPPGTYMVKALTPLGEVGISWDYTNRMYIFRETYPI